MKHYKLANRALPLSYIADEMMTFVRGCKIEGSNDYPYCPYADWADVMFNEGQATIWHSQSSFGVVSRLRSDDPSEGVRLVIESGIQILPQVLVSKKMDRVPHILSNHKHVAATRWLRTDQGMAKEVGYDSIKDVIVEVSDYDAGTPGPKTTFHVVERQVIEGIAGGYERKVLENGPRNMYDGLVEVLAPSLKVYVNKGKVGIEKPDSEEQAWLIWTAGALTDQDPSKFVRDMTKNFMNDLERHRSTSRLYSAVEAYMPELKKLNGYLDDLEAKVSESSGGR